MRDFGAKADGITLNVATIQKVIDFSHEQGGGRVAFTLGDFVTGLIYLKLGVTKCEVVRKRKRRCLKRQPSFFVMQPVYYPFLYLKYLWSSQLLLFEKSSYRNK